MYELVCGHQVGDLEELDATDILVCPFGHGPQAIREIVSTATPSPVINGTKPERAYGCSWGCGNPYDYVIINVGDGTTEFLCLVCYLKLAQEIINAVVNPDDPDVKAALAEYNAIERAPMTSGRVRARGRNAPADIDDDDLIEAFDSRITDDES
jgi:hypothetical protein